MKLGYVRRGADMTWEVMVISQSAEAPGLEYHTVTARSQNPLAVNAAIRLMNLTVLTMDEVYERRTNVIKLG